MSSKSSQIQSVVFLRKKWNVTEARKWLKLHGNLKPIKAVDKNSTQLRFRLQNPKKFKRFITKKVKDDVLLIIGFKK